MSAVKADANGNGGIDIDVITPSHGISFALARSPALTLAVRIMTQLGVVSLTANPDGTWTAR